MCALNGISKIGLKCQKHILERRPLELPPYLRISGVQKEVFYKIKLKP
jgi:hypothetical protein